MTKQDAIQIIKEDALYNPEVARMAVRSLEAVAELGEELRMVRGGIKNDKVLMGFNMAVAICNKYLEEVES